jgi:hypothetical protein
MSAVEIEEAVTELFGQPFDPDEFPFAFLEAYGNKSTTTKRLRKGNSNKSKVTGGVLQRNNIHLATCAVGEVATTLRTLGEAPETGKQKAKFILAADGEELQAEDLGSGETLVCAYADFPNHFTFFFALAGISTVREIKESTFDIRATSRLNKLYVELLRANPDWAGAERREEMNHFMARLIFCFFAEDTSIFRGDNLFTGTVETISNPDGGNVHEIIAECFRSMDTHFTEKDREGIRVWARSFPYVNGQLFSGSRDCPRFSKIARSYLLHVGNLNWKQINPDIFGSMIQAVADEDERASLGMHYTSVPNILKVLNPLFLDELREQLEAAGDNTRKLAYLRRRIARIRVFDPACGSGNFLVIAYKQLREIEYEINTRRGEADRKTEIPLTNFRGIELKSFSAEVARLALIIAEYQCDVLYLGQQLALAEFLPLDSQNWITCGNALRIDWLSVCPPTGESVKMRGDDLFGAPAGAAEVEFENEGGETFICGNPPYRGNAKKTSEQKKDLKLSLGDNFKKWGLLDYVCGWFYKADDYLKHTLSKFAFVATNSIVQGQHIPYFWQHLFENGLRFFFAVRSFKWSNLASDKAGVTVVIIGGSHDQGLSLLIDGNSQKVCENINAYLLSQPNYWVNPTRSPISSIHKMVKGNYYGLSKHLLLDHATKSALLSNGFESKFIKRFYGSTEIINNSIRHCLWFIEYPSEKILSTADIEERLKDGREERSKSKDAVSNGMVDRPHQFREMNQGESRTYAIPVVSSENRDYLPVDMLSDAAIISNKCFALFDAPLWNLALIASRLHWVWIGTVCVRMRTDFSYSNTLGWNTFPLPPLLEKQKADLTRTAEDILLARERHFPATIAELYDPERMPEDLRRAHERNDEVLERIYIGRRFKNDTERLEKLFQLYTEMVG